MIKKSARYVLKKIKEQTISDLEEEVSKLRVEVEAAQNESNRLIREAIVEQRQQADKILPGGVLQVSDREIATRIFNGLIMYLDPRDIAITPHIVFEGIWERWVTNAWLAALEEQGSDAVVLDIGANNGYYGMLAARGLNKRTSKVVLFEPNPQLLPNLHKTLSVNWLNENTIVEQLGISDTEGTAKLNVLKDYIGSSSMQPLNQLDSYVHHKMQVQAEEVVKVQTTTIDAYCKKNKIDHVNLIIMDIEGFEEKAYGGMRETIAKSADVALFIEFTPQGYKQPEQFYEQMRKDFGFVYTLGENGEFKKSTKSDYSNVVKDTTDYTMLVFSKKDLSSRTGFKSK